MHHREVLGPADVTDEQLTLLVGTLLHEPADRVHLLDSCAEEVSYDLPAITTAGRYWVRGTARVAGRTAPFAFFVKHVQSWSRSPLFAEVPPQIASMAEKSVPWRTEPLAYRSDLGDRLPDGLRMPRALGVFDLDEKSASIWLEEVVTAPAVWDLARYARAAHLLGRLAASPSVRERADVGEFGWTVHDYLIGRLRIQVLPLLHDADIWKHPLVARAFDNTLRSRLRRLADQADELVDELGRLPMGVAHGDACPNNLLVTPELEGFVLIDYGFWTAAPVGFDLGQLLVGDVQIGRQDATNLRAVDDVIVPAYVGGLHAEGCDITESVVRRAHALHLMVFTGLSILPFEHLAAEPTPSLDRMAAERAAIARFCLGLVDETQ
ncbi:MAG: phosphotransferase [Aeromicrobium sp.]